MSKSIDEVTRPGADPRILRGGPYGDGGVWIVEVEITASVREAQAEGDGLTNRRVVSITRAELAEWRARKE